MDLKKTLKTIREEIEKGEEQKFTNEANRNYLHSIALALEALLEIEIQNALPKNLP